MEKFRLIVFLKAPRPGGVKTRLAATLGANEACAAYQTMVETLLRKIAPLENVELCFTPDDARSEVESWAQPSWNLTPQGPGDLGERLTRAFHNAFAGGATRVVIIGSDCPEVMLADIESAWTELRAQEVVLGPAADGGYWLIGLNASQPALFEEISWGTGLVLKQTLARIQAIGLRAKLLRELADIDAEADWRQYLARLAATPVAGVSAVET